MDPQDALYAACRRYPSGIKGLAERRDTTPARLYEVLDKGNPRNRGFAFGDELDDLIDQLRAANTPRWTDVLQAFCYRHGGVFVFVAHDEDAEAAPADVTADIVEMVMEQGRLAEVVRASFAGDQMIDSQELEAFDAVHARCLAALARMGEHMKMLHAQAVTAGKVR